jgi:hypothetical protein
MTTTVANATTECEPKLLYSSSNGDRWFLLGDNDSGRKIVRHQPNRSSGGFLTDTDVEDFLSRDGQGPQHDALRRFLG